MHGHTAQLIGSSVNCTLLVLKVQDWSFTSRIRKLLPSQVPTRVATMHEQARDNRHKADGDFALV
jgi:hypothetical protein